VPGLVVNEAAVSRNLAAYGVFAATERVLMAAAKAGADRQAMHEVLRQHSLAAWAEVSAGRPNPLTDLLCADERMLRYLPEEQMRRLLDASAYVGDAALRARAMAARIQTV
jgi:adenylosuccinate lyase